MNEYIYSSNILYLMKTESHSFLMFKILTEKFCEK